MAPRRRAAAIGGKALMIIQADEGSSNVFADLDLPRAEQELLKARLTLQIYKRITARGLTQAKALNWT